MKNRHNWLQDGSLQIITGSQFALILTITSLLRLSYGYECNINSVVTLKPEVGDSGTITSANYPNAYPRLRGFCQVDFNICPGCVLDVRFDDVDLKSCPRDFMFSIEDILHGHQARMNRSLCDVAEHCDYIVWWSEDEGLRQLTGHLTGTVITTHSSSPPPWLHFCYSTVQTNAGHIKRWKIDFIVNDQYTYRVYGSSVNEESSYRPHQGVLRSTGFPLPTNQQRAEYTYLLQGQLEDDRVLLTFDDFYINAEHSLLTIFDSSIVNRSLHHMSYSGLTHPSNFMSTSPHILLHYSASPINPAIEYKHPQWGFKASYRFVNKDDPLLEETVITKCEIIHLYSGGVLIQGGSTDIATYDCIWPLPCPPQHASSLTLLNVSLPQDGSTILEIKNAYHSDGKILAEISTTKDLLDLHTLNFESDGGLYVRLRGQLRKQDVVSFSYTIFRPLSESTVSADKEIRPSARRNASTCHYPMIYCGEGRCVNHAAHCYIHPAKNCWGPWNIPCDNKQRCYRIEEKCDKANNCGDNTDENDCLSVIAHSLGHVWFFFLPIVLLAFTFAGGCVIYKTRKSRNQYRAGQAVSSDNIQMHTFPGGASTAQPVAPPSYSDVIAAPDTYIPSNPREETEPPPSYASVARLQAERSGNVTMTTVRDPCPPYSELPT